jgi:O-antigen/teichoic acid export membrane protein
VGSALLFLLAKPISRWLFESGEAADLVRIMVLSGILSTAVLLLLAGLRAEERAAAYSSVVLLQFVVAMVLNIVFVVQLSMGVKGVLLGNLLSHFLSLPVAVWLVSSRAEMSFEPRLVRPLLTFGLLVVPGVVTAWINNFSDRYILNLFGQLDEVAIYGIGYKFGMVIQFLIVWPFQLGWPALAFAISNRPEHKATYSRVLTYLTAILGAAVVAMSVLSRFVVPVAVGQGYEGAFRVVPYVALGYAFTGIYFCLSPGIHVAGKTRYLPILLGVSASVNIALNFALIPHFGMMGAAAATTLSFLVSASGAWVLAQKFYPVEYETSRLLKIAAAGAVSYMMSLLIEPQAVWAGVLWFSFWGLAAFPLFLLIFGFFRSGEISEIKQLFKHRLFRA